MGFNLVEKKVKGEGIPFLVQNEVKDQGKKFTQKEALDMANANGLLALVSSHINIQTLPSPTGSPKYGTTRKNTQRYYTTKSLVRYIY